MNAFRAKRLKVLVATDVAARGLDVDCLTHVINYNLPEDVESYTHRSGRTGRAGKEGISIAIIHSKEKGKLRRIEEEVRVQASSGRRRDLSGTIDVLCRQDFSIRGSGGY